MSAFGAQVSLVPTGLLLAKLQGPPRESEIKSCLLNRLAVGGGGGWGERSTLNFL